MNKYVSCTISASFKLNFSSYLLQSTFQLSIIDYVFFNFYLFKVSSKSTFSLVFWDLSNIDLFFSFLGLIEYRFILYFFEYRFPTLGVFNGCN